jgi:hypothetical protein
MVEVISLSYYRRLMADLIAGCKINKTKGSPKTLAMFFALSHKNLIFQGGI